MRKRLIAFGKWLTLVIHARQWQVRKLVGFYDNGGRRLIKTTSCSRIFSISIRSGFISSSVAIILLLMHSQLIAQLYDLCIYHWLFVLIIIPTERRHVYYLNMVSSSNIFINMTIMTIMTIMTNII